MPQVFLNDVTLREGAQVAGGAMEPDDQLTFVQMLVENGMDMIEIGYPASSAENMQNCRRIVEFVKSYPKMKKPLLSGLARAIEADIFAVKEAGCDVCHIYIPTSDQLRKSMFKDVKYGKTDEEKKEWVLRQAAKMVGFARDLGFSKVEYSPEDSARTGQTQAGFKYLCRIVEAVIDAGADIVNIPDTTGLRILDQFGKLIKKLFEKVPNISQAVISVHCHNDSDCSTNNALYAIKYGARQVEGTFFGLGERSGMTKFETLIMNLTSNPEFNDIALHFNPAACKSMVDFVAGSLAMSVPRQWPVVGLQNSLCSSGTHQAIEVRAKKQGRNSAYYGWKPERYGNQQVKTVLNTYSGQEGFREKLTLLGFRVNSGQLKAIYQMSMRKSASKGNLPLSDREISAIVQDVVQEIPFPIEINRCQVVGGGGTMPVAAVEIGVNGDSTIVENNGNGPFDALMLAILKGAAIYYPELQNISKFDLVVWKVRNITQETGSLADFFTCIRVYENDEQAGLFSGQAIDPDTIQAAAVSFARCLSWFLASK